MCAIPKNRPHAAAAVAGIPERADYWEKYAAIYYEDGDYDTVVER